MAKEVMTRRASDNAYLHKDFHGALSTAIDYLQQTYGREAVRQYLRQFAASYYAPLKRDICSRGLVALKEYFEQIYAIEGGKVEIDLFDDELTLRIFACPAVTHMRENGYAVAELFYETHVAVNDAICEDTPFAAEMPEYDQATGRSVQRFFGRLS